MNIPWRQLLLNELFTYFCLKDCKAFESANEKTLKNLN